MSSASETQPDDAALLLWHEGPFAGVERRLRVRGRRHDPLPRAAVYLAVGWCGFLLVCGLEAAVTGRWSPLLYDLAVHTRWVLSVPLLVLAEQVAARRVGESSAFLIRAGVIPEERERAHRAFLGTIRDLDRSAAVEGVLAAVALGLGVAAVRRSAPDVASVYYQLVSLSLFRFLAFRWIFRWLLWGVLVWHVSRQPLRLLGSHPDRVGGVGVLALPSRSFGLVVLAASIVLASEWGELMYRESLPAAHFITPMLVFVALAVVLALAPLVPLLGPVVESRVRSGYELSLLARLHGRSFNARWIQRDPGDPLGSPDMSSMADLGSVTQGVVSLPVIPFPRILVIEIVCAALAPMVPLFLSRMSVDMLVEHLVKNFVGV